MSIYALALYGSCARGDDHKESDIDLIAITNDDLIHKKELNKLNTFFYPRKAMIKKAEEGDLFALHILEEAKFYYDDIGFKEELKSKFKYKTNYKKEISDASSVIWCLVSEMQKAKKVSYGEYNKILVWCIRTILIAHSAEDRKPVFSAEGLQKFSKIKNVSNLIKIKDLLEHANDMNPIIMKVLKKYGTVKPELGELTWPMYFKTNNIEMGMKIFSKKSKRVQSKYL